MRLNLPFGITLETYRLKRFKTGGQLKELEDFRVPTPAEQLERTLDTLETSWRKPPMMTNEQIEAALSRQLFGILPISDAPRDKTRILICHYPRHFGRWREGPHLMKGYRSAPEPKWEECWWDKDYRSTRMIDGQVIGVEGRWTPWCGTHTTKSSLTIETEHIVGWVTPFKVNREDR